MLWNVFSWLDDAHSHDGFVVAAKNYAKRDFIIEQEENELLHDVPKGFTSNSWLVLWIWNVQPHTD